MKFADQRFRRASAIPTDAGTQSPRHAEIPASGRPLEPDTRGFFERRFGHDFSRVRIHADDTAAFSARTNSAAAYTVGTDIVFGAGMYRPGSSSGTRLLAHELAHVVQQDRGGGTAASGNHESEARAASDRIASGQRPSVTLAAPTAMQRQPLPGTPSTDLTEGASPFLAAAIGSVTLDGFDTGKSIVSPDNRSKLARTAETIAKLFRQYPASTVRVIGYTDAVGKESDNLVLGQSRADAVQAALLDMGVSGAAVQTESRGANEPVVRSSKAEARNRRVEVRFDPSRLLRGAFTEGLTPPTMTPPGAGTTAEPDTGKRVDTGIGNLCLTNPALCYGTGQGYPGGPTTRSPGAMQPLPDLTPYELMDVSGPYTSHGGSQSQGGDLRATWRALYEKYRWKWGLPKNRAADLANSEMNGTANKNLGRDNPNAADRLDREMQNANPDAKKIGPADITIFRF
jgi:outer membrane protein OmpA-like peptidoglycan-associated protein